MAKANLREHKVKNQQAMFKHARISCCNCAKAKDKPAKGSER